MSDETTVREAVAAWEGWLRMRRSTGTTAKYAQLVRDFVDEFGDRPIDSLTAEEVELDYLSRFADKSVSTQRNRHAALKSLFDCCERFDWVTKSPLRNVEVPARDDSFKGYLSAKDDVAVQEAPRTLQEAALVMLLRHTGLRISEALALTWDDVDLDGGKILAETPAVIVRKSKTPNGRRTVPIPPILIPVLKKWKAHNGGRFVLQTKSGAAMSPQFAHRLVVRVGASVGVKISPHALRRQYASVALNNGAPLHVVSRALGHSSTGVTEKSYARLSNDRVAAEILAVTA